MMNTEQLYKPLQIKTSAHNIAENVIMSYTVVMFIAAMLHWQALNYICRCGWYILC